MIGHRIVFIGGLHRSGTTALAAALGYHPSITALSGTGVIEDEGQFLQPVYPSDSTYGGAGRFAFHPEMHMTERDLPVDRAATAARLFEAWSPCWDLSRPVLVEKSPPNCIKARYLAGLFEDSRFIFLTRHPIAVSLATRKWSHTGPFALLSHWIHAHRLIREDMAHLGNCALVSYEQLTREPQKVMAALQRFIGVDVQEMQMDFAAVFNERYFSEWSRSYAGIRRASDTPSVTTGRLSRTDAMMADIKARFWKTARYLTGNIHAELILPRREVNDALAVLEPSVNEFGYSLSRLTEYPELMIKLSDQAMG